MRNYEVRGTDAMLDNAHDNMLTQYKRHLNAGNLDWYLNLSSAEERQFNAEYNAAKNSSEGRDIIERWQRRYELELRAKSPVQERRPRSREMLWEELKFKAKGL